MWPEDQSPRTTIDRAVDRVVADMVSGMPAPGLARRVVDAIEAERAGSMAKGTVRPWRLALAATAAACLVLAVVMTNRRWQVPAPAPSEIAGPRAAAENTGSEFVGVKPGERPAKVVAADSTRSTPVLPAESGRSTTTGPARGAVTLPRQGPPMLEPIRVEPLEPAEPVLMAALSPVLDPLVANDIEVEALTLDPLDERLPWPPAYDRDRQTR